MTFEHDFQRFSDWFDVLAVTHRISGGEDLRQKMKAEYFDVLQSYPTDAVESAYQTLRRKMKKWPVPADWLEALPPSGSVSRLPELTRDEMRENDRAEALGYEAEDICKCTACVTANCVMPPRYVPRLDGQGREMERRHPVRAGRAVLLGRWLHGAELRAWYSARAVYYGLKGQIDAAEKAETTRKRTPEERMQRMTRLARLKIAEDLTQPGDADA